MRSLFAFSKFFDSGKYLYPVINVLIILSLACSCAHKDISMRGDREEVTGTIVIRGEGPMSRTAYILDDNGTRTLIEKGRWQDELVNLRDRRVRIRGSFHGSARFGYSVAAEAYELIPPDGMTAVRGFPENRQGEGWFIADSGSRKYILKGGLEAAIVEFEGYELWVWGRVVPAEGEEKLISEGYVVVGHRMRQN